MRLAVTKDGKGFGEPKIVPTPGDFSEGISCFAKAAHELTGGEAVSSVAGGIAGVFNKEMSQLVNSPNLAGWVGKPLQAELAAVTHSDVSLRNDAALAALGEATFGAGKGYAVVAYVTVGTGVGGARIVQGKIDGHGFEPGHQSIDLNGPLCPSCNVPGHLEGYVSGKSVARQFGKKPKEITDAAIWEELARIFAVGLANTLIHWSPDVLVLGGSMMKVPGIPVDRVEFHLKKVLKIFPEPPPIRKAALGDIGGLWGAITYLDQMSNI